MAFPASVPESAFVSQIPGWPVDRRGLAYGFIKNFASSACAAEKSLSAPGVFYMKKTIRADHVGSLLRPPELLQAREAFGNRTVASQRPS